MDDTVDIAPVDDNSTTADGRRVAYIVSEELVKVSSLLPSNRHRSFLVHALVSKLGLLSANSSFDKAIPTRPRQASETELCSYHDSGYVSFVLDSRQSNSTTVSIAESEYGIEDDCPPFPGLNRYVQLVAGATLTAVDVLKNGKADIAISWDGGRHHAQKSRASGFCYVADCILAILSLKKSRLAPSLVIKPRVMYLDLDLHFSDAVSHAFHASLNAKSSQVLSLSIHHSALGFFPLSLLSSLPNLSSSDFDPFTLSIPLRQGASSKTFARIWPVVEAVKSAFEPDYVVLQCGVDGLAGDPCAIWNWNIGLEQGDMGWYVNNVIRLWNCKVLMLGGGGYHSPNAARAWAYLTSVAIGRPLPLDTAIPDHSAFPLYAPSFILDVPAGNMHDENSDEYLSQVELVFSHVVEHIREQQSMSV